MWLLNFLPDWIFYGMFFVGILGMLASFVLQFIPFVTTYRLLIQIVSVILIVIGTYMSGAISNNEKWEAKVKDLQIKLKDAELRASQNNVQIQTKYIDRIKIIKQKDETVQQQIDQSKDEINKKCQVTPEMITILNNAAKIGDDK